MKLMSPQNEPENSSESQYKLSLTGKELNTSPVLKPKEEEEDIFSVISSLENQILNLQTPPLNLPQLSEEKSPTVESPHLLNVKTWKGKLNTSEVNSLTTKLYQTLDQVSTLNEKDLTPFWTSQSKEISKKLWLPIKTDSVDSVLTSSKESSTNTQMGKSWFSINKKLHPKANSQETSFQLLQFSLPVSMDSEATNSKTKSKTPVKKYKTLKIRLFPNEQQKITLELMINQQRWYYNALVHIMNTKFSKERLYLESKSQTNPDFYEWDSWNKIELRNILSQYEYKESVQTIDNKEVIVKDFVLKENPGMPIPVCAKTGQPWWNRVYSRVPRGAVAKYTSSLNSGISNLRAKNIGSHEMKFQSKKKPIETLHFDDGEFPSVCTDIKSQYWFRIPRNQTQRKYEKTGTKRMRARLSLSQIISHSKKNGLEVIHDKIENKFFIHYPIDENWYPIEDIRNEKQVTNVKDTIISLDPGVRKFLVGYDPHGVSIFFGEDAQSSIIPKLLDIDESKKNPKEDTKSHETRKQIALRKNKRIRNLVDEMHWKCISYLVSNYETIMYPDYRVSEMLKKNKLGKMTKRVMTVFSSYRFKERLRYQCEKYKRRLIIVDESYTSCTCGQCGFIHRGLKGSEIYSCPKCNMSIDRDVNGSRNILLKNLKTLNKEGVDIEINEPKKRVKKSNTPEEEKKPRKPRVSKIKENKN
jgi:transposase